ncbi:proton myo-inositol cotransporter-like isoform X2 [Tubulanus polymorphus]|uniref:proton myo-inositol cotransporter-like isoform X2 n=1 Tax=Tubulanus polymorphus TaxID=672921 RepID=UPI003DA65897
MSDSPDGFVKQRSAASKQQQKEDRPKMSDKEPLLAAAVAPPSSDESVELQNTAVSYGSTPDDEENVPKNEINGDNSQSDEVHMPAMTNFVYVIAFFACIGGFLFGYDTGVVSGAMIFIVKQFGLDEVWTELIVSVTIGAAAVFSFVGGFLNDKFGRKPTILLASFIFTVGAVILGFSQNKYHLLIGRIVIGAGIGFTSMTTPVYLAEVSVASDRGRVVTLYQMSITVGILLSGIMAGAFSYYPTSGWRYMLGLAGVPSVIQFIGFFFMPESPRWLVINDRHEQARKVLSVIRDDQDVDKELETIQESLLETRREQSEHGNRNILVAMFKDPVVRKALVVGCGLQMFQQISGINTVMYYSATIIKMSGVRSDSSAVWLAALTAATNFLFTFVGLYLVEKIGRRSLIISSQAGVVFSLIALGIGFNLASVYSPDITQHGFSVDQCNKYQSCDACISNPYCGFCYTSDQGSVTNSSCLAATNISHERSQYGPCNRTNLDASQIWAYSYCPTPYSWMAVAGLVIYLAFFAPGMGPMPWTINSEIYPLWARSAGAAVATSTNWIFNLIISMTFLSLTLSITKYGAFYLYGCLAFLGLLFSIWLVPETKGKQLEEVQELFKKPWLKCC